MIKKAFWDTCVAIAFVFQLNSLHTLSKKAFNSYDKHYWSNFVKIEYERRHEKKFENLSNFFNDLSVDLDAPEKEFYSIEYLKQFVLKNYSNKMQEDAKNSIESFWDIYIGMQSQIPYYNLINNINECVKDLSQVTESNSKILDKKMQLTPKRTGNYQKIAQMLESEGVKKEDCHVVLDGHDFAKTSSDSIDFITFDKTLYNGSKNIGILSFHSIKGKYDFN